MPGYIQRLIEEGEHQQLDFKFEIADAHKIARTLVAFANTDGGRLLIGVKDNGSIAGVRSHEEYFMVEAAARMYCRPALDFSFKEWHISKRTVLEVIIKKSSVRPHYAKSNDGKWTPYLRSGDQNFIANHIILKVWKWEKSPKGVYMKFTDTEKFLLTYLEANASITLSKFMRMACISRNKAENILVRFILLKFIAVHFFENDTVYCLLSPGDKLEKV